MDRDEQDLAAILGEFFPDDEEVKRQIEAEWKRMHDAGEEIRVGDAPALLFYRWVFYRWAESMGTPFLGALGRRPNLRHDEEEDG